jgi:hypothetical protein
VVTRLEPSDCGTCFSLKLTALSGCSKQLSFYFILEISAPTFLQKYSDFSVTYLKSTATSYLFITNPLPNKKMVNSTTPTNTEANTEANRPQLSLEQIRIHHKLKEFLLPASASESAMLEEDILQQGQVREKLLLWQSSEGEYFVLDGHRRFEILKKHSKKDIKWAYEVAGKFDSIHELKWWISRQKLMRQNLTSFMVAYLRGRMYEEVKKEPYRPRGQKEARGKTKHLLAAEYKVSAATIERDAAFYKGVNRFADFYWEEENLKEKILRQESIFNKGDLEIIGKLNLISPELLYRYKQLIGNFEDLLQVPAEEREDFIRAFCVHNEDLSDPEQTEIFKEKEQYSIEEKLEYEGNYKDEIKQLIARASTPPQMRRFEKWVDQQYRQIGKILNGKSKSSLESKKQELSYCLEKITGLVEALNLV